MLYQLVGLQEKPLKKISTAGQKKCRVETPISEIREGRFGTIKSTFRSLDEVFMDTALQTKSQEKSSQWRDSYDNNIDANL